MYFFCSFIGENKLTYLLTYLLTYILKYHFSSSTSPSILTLIDPLLLDRSNETCWIFPTLKSTSHFLIPSSARSLMYSRKSVGPRMEPSGTPALTGYSCEDFPSRTTQSHQLLRKEEIRTNIWSEIPEDLSFWRRAPCQTLSKALDISTATAPVAPAGARPVKRPSSFIRHNCEKICSWSRRPKTTPEIRKKATFLQVINNSFI